ncbi:hypothetical protein TNIN_194601 [Trichonephila inaurata madagascariensis]|uniref:Uncharacterized protein n=1 Tax=Trichonephila inaurata madagascariensis TaxID=2747483 RepID=A0A8X6XYS8_9ARAC|nr:hypothetical protein TNIN_194601 [Trichonephila inaurata madagascariensis]
MSNEADRKSTSRCHNAEGSTHTLQIPTVQYLDRETSINTSRPPQDSAVAATLYLVAGFNVFPQKVIETNGELPLGAARSCWWNLMKECHKDP